MWYPVHIGDPGDQGGCGCVLLGIAGEFGGRMLQALPSESMSWLLWFGAHPDTKILKDPDQGAVE
jgi:hypothetical protein